MSPLLARGVKVLSEAEAEAEAEAEDVDEVVPRSATDTHWIGELSKTGRWCIVSTDGFKKQHRAESEALRRDGHLVFVLAPEWSGQPYWSKTAQLVTWWPQILRPPG
ncbi:hypothetical protein GmRootV213_06460 [Variovorax sp. V213]|uniref:PIN-like domain-containing protein n=1 Tax=Variovorax sp. V213 TaxID=3065955 RepID=UPI0034E8EC01